jgi:hypothetical protein
MEAELPKACTQAELGRKNLSSSPSSASILVPKLCLGTLTLEALLQEKQWEEVDIKYLIQSILTFLP